jgi:hypothetical protein
MNKVVTTSVGALEIAGSLCGVPYVGAAAVLLRDIIAYSDQVAGQRVTLQNL